MNPYSFPRLRLKYSSLSDSVSLKVYLLSLHPDHILSQNFVFTHAIYHNLTSHINLLA